MYVVLYRRFEGAECARCRQEDGHFVRERGGQERSKLPSALLSPKNPCCDANNPLQPLQPRGVLTYYWNKLEQAQRIDYHDFTGPWTPRNSSAQLIPYALLIPFLLLINNTVSFTHLLHCSVIPQRPPYAPLSNLSAWLRFQESTSSLATIQEEGEAGHTLLLKLPRPSAELLPNVDAPVSLLFPVASAITSNLESLTRASAFAPATPRCKMQRMKHQTS